MAASKVRKPRLTWSRQPDEKGLARVCQSERGRVLKVNGVEVASVYAIHRRYHERSGYYWVARGEGIELANTFGVREFAKIEEAAADCENYVRAELAKSAPVGA